MRYIKCVSNKMFVLTVKPTKKVTGYSVVVARVDNILRKNYNLQFKMLAVALLGLSNK